MKYIPQRSCVSRTEVLTCRISASDQWGTTEGCNRGAAAELISVFLADYNFIFTELSGSSTSVLTKYISVQLSHAVQSQYVFFPGLLSAASTFMGLRWVFWWFIVLKLLKSTFSIGKFTWSKCIISMIVHAWKNYKQNNEHHFLKPTLKPRKTVIMNY